jgi:hypothetical protein
MRLPKLTDLSPRQQEISDRITSRRGGTRGPFLVWLRSPELCEKVEALGAYCRFESSLDPRLRELSLLIAARHWECAVLLERARRQGGRARRAARQRDRARGAPGAALHQQGRGHRRTGEPTRRRDPVAGRHSSAPTGPEPDLPGAARAALRCAAAGIAGRTTVWCPRHQGRLAASRCALCPVWPRVLFGPNGQSGW